VVVVAVVDELVEKVCVEVRLFLRVKVEAEDPIDDVAGVVTARVGCLFPPHTSCPHVPFDSVKVPGATSGEV